MSIRFGVSSVCTAFDEKTIGSKVVLMDEFINGLTAAVESYDSSGDQVPGQHFVIMPQLKHTVSAGDGKKSDNAEDYIVRTHREGPKMFLRRECAGEVQFLACVVYTREAYMADPDYDPSESLGDATHIIVAVIASSGPAAPVTPFRFVHNLAGGNLEYQRPKCDDMDDREVIDALTGHIDWLESKAEEVKDYWNNYNVVAD